MSLEPGMQKHRTLVVISCLWLAAAVMVTGCGSAEDTPEPTENDIYEARAAARRLGSALKTRLVAAMQEGGPQAGVAVCAEEAPDIARRLSAETGVTVGRTALRVRNPQNAPDPWERRQIETFMTQQQAGADPARLEASTINTGPDGTFFRWAKPILMDAPCTVCHGKAINSDLYADIKAIYPDDKATGFAPGEIRGIFTVKKKLSSKIQ